MSQNPPDIEAVQSSDHYYHVQVRSKELFSEFRTPLSESETPRSIGVEGTDVREGRMGTDTWLVESVLIPLDAVDDEDAARDLARRIVDAMET